MVASKFWISLVPLSASTQMQFGRWGSALTVYSPTSEGGVNFFGYPGQAALVV